LASINERKVSINQNFTLIIIPPLEIRGGWGELCILLLKPTLITPLTSLILRGEFNLEVKCY
jgi:hypothetical protein